MYDYLMDLRNLNVSLKGKKTYIVIVASICYALGGAVAGFLDWNTAIIVILGALGIGGMRNALPKPKPSVPVETPQE